MLLTVTYEPERGSDIDATVLGFLLHKHPAKVQTFSAPVGEIHVFYPEASSHICTVAMMLDVDPIGLVRHKRFRGDTKDLGHYINDRPYTASSMLAVAIGTVFRTAMSGRSDSYPDLASAPLPLRIDIPVVSTRGTDANLITRLFEPCGWTVDEQQIPLDDAYPEWGLSRYSAVTLAGQVRLAHALRQLYVFLPVLDDAKHYWVGDEEVAKLERAGQGWLDAHPERELITRRYLLHQRALINEAAVTAETPPDTPLRSQRADAVETALRDVSAHRVVDMGCGTGALLSRLAKDSSFSTIIGVDVSARSLERARRRLHLDEASDAARERVQLLHGSAVYRDDRLRGYDAMVLMEVIEHIEPSRLTALEDAVFAGARPASVIVTTPNAEYNTLYPSLVDGAFRHDDHRFEWTRGQFQEWAEQVGGRYGYSAEHRAVGPADDAYGSPTQLVILRREVTA